MEIIFFDLSRHKDEPWCLGQFRRMQEVYSKRSHDVLEGLEKCERLYSKAWGQLKCLSCASSECTLFKQGTETHPNTFVLSSVKRKKLRMQFGWLQMIVLLVAYYTTVCNRVVMVTCLAVVLFSFEFFFHTFHTLSKISIPMTGKMH